MKHYVGLSPVTTGLPDLSDPIACASGYQEPTSGTVNGNNRSFVFTTAPNVLVVDGLSIRKVSSDGTVNWTGTTSITLEVAPNYDMFAIA